MIAAGTDAIVVKDLRKSFRRHGKSMTALDGVSFELRQGERLAFLGPNGAGKTTMIRCLCGRTRADSGSIRLLGQELVGRGVSLGSARHQLGLVPQEIALYQDLTTRENLHAFGRFHGLTGQELRDQVEWALQWTGLQARGDDLVGTFSGGMKRRVNLACGVLHRPEVLLLDEPSVGVDPQSRQRIFQMLRDLNALGTSVLLTTHHLDEAESQCDRIVIMDHGRVVQSGTFDELIQATVGSDRQVTVKLDGGLRGDGNEKLACLPFALSVIPGQAMVSAKIQDVGRDLPQLIESVSEAGYGVVDVEVQTPTLHHVFLHLTGHALRD